MYPDLKDLGDLVSILAKKHTIPDEICPGCQEIGCLQTEITILRYPILMIIIMPRISYTKGKYSTFDTFGLLSQS